MITQGTLCTCHLNTRNSCEVLPQLPAVLARRNPADHACVLHVLQNSLDPFAGSLGARMARSINALQRQGRRQQSRNRVASITPSSHEYIDAFDEGDVEDAASYISDNAATKLNERPVY